ncbi:MAG TPA: hypothetical protein DC057_12675 [Spirochaetia bacterium]|nr:hypothetical protein [Spirochaetia bacterium]
MKKKSYLLLLLLIMGLLSCELVEEEEDNSNIYTFSMFFSKPGGANKICFIYLNKPEISELKQIYTNALYEKTVVLDEDGKGTYSISGIKPGQYSGFFYVDMNDNGRLDETEESNIVYSINPSHQSILIIEYNTENLYINWR